MKCVPLALLAFLGVGPIVGCRVDRADDLLFSAAETGDVADAKRALEDGADPLVPSEHDGRTTPLEMATNNGYSAVVRLMERRLERER